MAPDFRLRRILVAGIAIALTLLAPADSPAQSPAELLQKTRDTYAQLKSYADTGVELNQYGVSSEDKHTFSTAFNRSPRHVLLDFHKQGGDRYLIWADPNAFHTWWKTTGQQTDYPNPNNAAAISMSSEPTKNVSIKVPTLLYGEAFSSAMLNIADPVLDGTEDVGGQRCHRIVGRMSDSYAATSKEVNVRKVTVWIDVDSFLVRKMLEEWKALPGQRNRTVTTYQPRANPTLDDVSFKFTRPTQ